MKITGTENLHPPQPGQTRAPDTPDEKTDFGNLLQKAMGPTNSGGSVEKGTSLQEPMGIQRFLPISAPGGGLSEKASRAVDLLEIYSNSLADPGKTLKDIEPTLSAFVNETESMYQDYVESGNDSAELKEIMESLLRTARSESIRFQRGDYLDS